jgi:3-methyladenine DNA glycosylase AlkD
MPIEASAAQFLKKLKSIGTPEEAEKSLRYFKTGTGQYGEGDKFVGVRTGQLFELAKEFIEMPLSELEKLMDSPIHEARAGAISIMGKRARRKKTSGAERKELFELYLRRHDRVNNWDLVDLGALYIVGVYLLDKPRDILYRLARSKNMWERRTAIVGTGPFIKQGDIDDTFSIAEILINDEHDLIHKGVGWMLRTAGDKDQTRLCSFLDRHAATMPRTLLRYAIEKFEPKQREYYMGLKKLSASATKEARKNSAGVAAKKR